jgi:acylphosphatase
LRNEAGFLAVVYGRVQGVSFRYFALKCAQSLSLKGYVCNLPGGSSVEVVAEGERSGLEVFLANLNQGPTGAAVQEMDVRWTEASGSYQAFRIA